MANESAESLHIPIIIGALGLVTKKLRKNLEMINFGKGVEQLQKACLLGTAKIDLLAIKQKGLNRALFLYIFIREAAPFTRERNRSVPSPFHFLKRKN